MSHKVLVFESDAAFAGELRNELGKLGCSTSVVEDGNLGLQQAASDRPDLILLSIELPRMNGFSVCNKLKKDPSLKDVPLIIMSSESSDETFEQHRKLRTRAEDYVHKPIAFGELLQHIRSFVKLGADAAPAETDAILIDEDAEAEGEGTQVAMRPPNFVQGRKDVDPEIDSFADAAFGRLQTEEKRKNGASAAPAAVTDEVEAAAQAEPPPVPRGGPPRPPGVDQLELERLRGEVDRARNRAGDLERDLASAREELSRVHDDHSRESKSSDEAQRLQREVDELKAKLAGAGKAAGGVSSREFLDLREALNKKDKEILSLKEALTKKDKEIYESRDKSLALERAKNDLDDKILAADRELADAREKIDALTADKDNAKKVGEDFKARLSRSQAEVEAKLKEIAELKMRAQDEAAAHESYLGKLGEAHNQALAQAAQEKADDLAQAAQQRAQALEEAAGAAAREKAEALAQREAELRGEADQRFAAQSRVHHDEATARRNEHDQLVQELTAKYDRQLSDTLARHEAELAAAETRRTTDVANATQDGTEALQRREAQLQREHAERVANIENDREARIAQIESRAAHELEDARAQAEAQKNAADSRIADLEGQLGQTIERRDQLDTDLVMARGTIATLEADLAGTRQTLDDTRNRLANETARADRAVAKWEADKSSLDRAKDALAVALSQIEEAEART